MQAAQEAGNYSQMAQLKVKLLLLMVDGWVVWWMVVGESLMSPLLYCRMTWTRSSLRTALLVARS